jgi:hypothetical protein
MVLTAGWLDGSALVAARAAATSIEVVVGDDDVFVVDAEASEAVLRMVVEPPGRSISARGMEGAGG